MNGGRTEVGMRKGLCELGAVRRRLVVAVPAHPGESRWISLTPQWAHRHGRW
jgi:hypothetical protein